MFNLSFSYNNCSSCSKLFEKIRRRWIIQYPGIPNFGTRQNFRVMNLRYCAYFIGSLFFISMNMSDCWTPETFESKFLDTRPSCVIYINLFQYLLKLLFFFIYSYTLFSIYIQLYFISSIWISESYCTWIPYLYHVIPQVGGMLWIIGIHVTPQLQGMFHFLTSTKLNNLLLSSSITSKAWKQRRKSTKFDGVNRPMEHFFFSLQMTKQ